MGDLGGHYHEVRARLRNGNGLAVEDKGIDLRRGREITGSKGTSVRIHINSEAEQIRFGLQAQIDSLVQTVAGLVDDLGDYGEKLELLETRPVTTPADVTISRIVQLVAGKTGVSIVQIRGIRRNMQVVYCRHVISYLAANSTPKSLSMIGRALGNKDHTTIKHAIDKITARRPKDAKLDSELKWYEAEIARLTMTPAAA